MHEIRVATIRDATAIAEFQTAAWNDAYRDLVPAEYLARMTVVTRTDRWGRRIRTGDRVILLAELDGRLDGVASYREERGGDVELGSLYVAAGVRSTGLGSQLLVAAIKHRAAHLWVFRENPRAISFYRRHGFDLDGGTSIDDDTGLSLVRMRRTDMGVSD